MSNSPDFQWSEFLGLAKKLSSKGEASEAELRSAISRAYYAAFHNVRDLLEEKGDYVSTDKDTHQMVWDTCKNGRDPSLRVIGAKGFNLRDDRTKADYDNPFPENLPEKTKLVLHSAEYIMNIAKSRRSGK